MPTSITIDMAFDIRTLDPARMYEVSAQAVLKAMYDTLLTFSDEDTTTPIPSLATEFTTSDDLMEFTFTLDEHRTFADGTTVTADDVVFSLKRLQGIGSTPAFLLDGIVIKKIDRNTVKLITSEPCPALPAILATPSLGIVSRSQVEANGGVTNSADQAEEYLNSVSAGSGPYTLVEYVPDTTVILAKNPFYDGPQSPVYDKVVFRNADPATQKAHVEAGQAQVALGLAGEDAASLAEGIELAVVPSATVVFLFLNGNPLVSPLTPKPQVIDAVRAALDYPALVSLAGGGATQAAGLIPSAFPGTLSSKDATVRNLALARQYAEDAGLGDQTITLSYPNDIDPTGLSLDALAQQIQAQLAQAGITVDLAPAPFETEIDAYRGGEEEIGLWYWNPDYLDPATYLIFSPGRTLGMRAGWTSEGHPPITDLVIKGSTTNDPLTRRHIFETWAQQMNEFSPFIPLIQPAANIAHHPSVTGIHYNPVWILNVAALGIQ